jgi:hypothetical protein
LLLCEFHKAKGLNTALENGWTVVHLLSEPEVDYSPPLTYKEKQMKFLVHVTLVLVLIGNVFAQQPNNAAKLKRLDAEIEMYQGKKKTGMIITGVGLLVGLLAIPAFPTVECNYDSYDYSSNCEDKGSYLAFSGILGASTLIMSIGGYKWSNASANIRMLELKRYDLSFQPLYMPKQGGAVGLALVGRF